MGLYITLLKSFWRREDIIFQLYKLLIERLKTDFNFKTTSRYCLFQGFRDKSGNSEECLPKNGCLYSNEYFNVSKFLAKMDAKKILVHPGKKARFTVRVKGAIELTNLGGEKDTVFIDVNCTTTNFYELYGNVWITLYDSELLWYEYFIKVKENREKIITLIKEISQPSLNVFSIYLGKSNAVLDLLSEAFYIYFKEQKYLFNYLLRAFRDIKKENLEIEEIIFSEKTLELLEELQNDLTVYNLEKLPELIDISTTDYNRKTVEFTAIVHPEMIFNTISSIEIYDKNFNLQNVKNFLNDYIANFINSLGDSLPHYREIESDIKKGFGKHKFKKEEREQKDLENWTKRK